MDKSSRRPPPPPPGSTLPPVPPPPRDPAAPPLPRRNQAPPSAKETLDDFYEDMSPPKVVSPAPHRKYGSTQQPVGLLGGLVHVTSSENDPGKKKNTFLDSFRCLESKLQFNKPDVLKGKSSFLDKDRKISEPMRSLLPFSVEKVRRATVGDSTHPVPEISDDTYEIPEVKAPEPRLPPRPDPGANTFARPPPPESDSDDGDWDEDWDDAQTDHKQGEELYIEPDGGHVEDDPAPPPPPPPNHRRKLEQIQQPNVLQPNSKAPPLTPPNKPIPPPNKPAQTPMAAELKEKFSQFQSSKAIPLPKTDKKPQPPAKPAVENKPQLPPRGHEKLPPVPPIDTTDSKSDDNSSAGSSSSGPTSSSKPVKIVSPTGPVIRNQAKVQVFPALHATIKKIEEGLSKVPIRLPNHEPSESEEIYDDAITEKLTSFDWFHGELDRKEAERRVNQMRDNGAFLVRASTKGDPTNPYVLVVISEGKIKNLQLRQRHDKRFAIGNYKEDEVSFTNVPDLVNHHKTNNIKLADGGTVMLTRTPRK